MTMTALITGGGSGIGRAIALALARAKIPVVVNDIVQDAGARVVKEIQEAGGEGLFVRADVADSTQVKAMFSKIRQKGVKVDILVNNAGLPGPFTPITHISDINWHKTINVHLNGTFFCLREAARTMVTDGFGRIINMASIAGLVGTVGSAEYGAAKAAIINLTKTAAKELGPRRITVNAIAPGMVATPTNLKLKSKGSRFIESAVATTPTRRMTEPDEIAALVLFLTSAAAANINGQVIAIDGAAQINIGMDRYMQDFFGRQTAGSQD
jgi:NAD(P)-dependent dehydrogenase (short-subunit alcohol dehydrogenase family)